jgi:two-component system phosphate regulon sensor histidine kinase PhoR
MGTLVVLLITVVVLVVAVDRSLRRDLVAESLASLEREASLIREALPSDSLGWQVFARRSAVAASLRVTIIDRNGRVRADSDVEESELARIENHANRPEVGTALANGVGSNTRVSATVGRRLMYLAVAGGPGVIRVAMSYAQVDAIVARARRFVMVAAIPALLVGAFLASLAARRIARPLAAIGAAAQSISRGESPHLPFAGIPDVDRLSANLREMHRELVARFDSLKRKQSETAAIVDSMVEGVLSSDAKGEIVTANPAARRMLGYGESEPLPPLPMLFRSKGGREALSDVAEGITIANRETTLGDRTYLLNARSLPAGGTVVVLHDLTDVRRLEAVRRDFVANASHELKTPLTAISGYAETLLADRPDPETTRQFLETILSNARRMQRLVDDQLDLSRIESGAWSPSIDWTAIEPAAHEAWALARASQPEAPRLAIELAPDSSFVSADPEALRQVFRNLFENAVRHTPATGTVTVASLSEAEGTRISVADTGTGIAQEHLSRIFERFYRVDPSRSREQGGTGLGLAIVKHLVEGHGGRAWAESELGRGTTIQTWWPGGQAGGREGGRAGGVLPTKF